MFMGERKNVLFTNVPHCPALNCRCWGKKEENTVSLFVSTGGGEKMHDEEARDVQFQKKRTKCGTEAPSNKGNRRKGRMNKLIVRS